MERIKNNYCWNTIEDWQEAQKMGFTESYDFIKSNNEEKLRNLVKLAEKDCFPIQIVCVSVKGKKYVIEDFLMKKFCQFINNEIPIIEKDKQELFFQELPREKQDRIIKAKINSVWVSVESEEELFNF